MTGVLYIDPDPDLPCDATTALGHGVRPSKVRPIFAWFDLWVGVFIDRPNRRVYIFPIPCFGIVVERRKRKAVKS